MHCGLFAGGVVEVEGATAGELVDGWLVVCCFIAACGGGARLVGWGVIAAVAATAAVTVLGVG